MAKYLDNDGLLYFWQKIKNLFSTKDETVKNITRSGTTFTATRADGTTFTFTQQDNTVAKTTTTPKVNGTAAIGTETKYAAGDHVHPTDTTRAPLASPAFTGTPTAPTAAAATDTTQVATTEFVHDVIATLDTGVTGVKGSSETSYRTGNVNITAANIGVAAGAEVNQNAFGNVKVGTTTIEADSKTDTLELVAGSNVTITPDATNDKVTIAATDTVYTHPAYDAEAAAFVKVGRDATGHVVVGDAVAASDIPNLPASKITSGTLGVARGGTGVSTLGAGVVYHSASGTGALSIATAANIVSALGTTAVNRATADASGNSIADTYAKKTDIAGMYKYKGSVANEAALPSTGQTTGDVYNIEAASSYGGAGANVAWNGTAWDSLGEIFSIASITNAEIDTIVAS